MNLRSENLRFSDFQGEATLLIPRSLLRGAFIILVQWHGLRPNASGFVPLSIAELSL
jgi:hypothetical protein